MSEIVDVPISDLLLDAKNPRLPEEVGDSQQEIALALARVQGESIVGLARDIVEQHSTDPTTLVCIVGTNDRLKRYKVVEGNRRVLALKALETPALISPVLSSNLQSALQKLSRRYLEEGPLDWLTCALLDSEEDANHWVHLRHTGSNQGAGLVSWGNVEKDRYAARHGKRTSALQVLEFVEKHGELSERARASTTGIGTSITRLVSNPQVRQALGIDFQNGQVLALHPLEEVAKSLSKMVDDLKTGRTQVKDIYTVEDRIEYARRLPRAIKPKANSKLPSPVPLDDLTSGSKSTRSIPPKKPKRRKSETRTTLIPKSCDLDIDPPRINRILFELLTLNLEQYANAASVLFRVFVELSVDHYLSSHSLMTDKEMREVALAKRMKKAAGDLHSNNKIVARLLQVVNKIGDSKGILRASVPTFNMYVHNEYAIPSAGDLRAAWDEIEPFMVALWKNVKA